VSQCLFSCQLCPEKGHLPLTLYLSKAFDLSFTPKGKLSVRRKKGVQWNVASMVCEKTMDAHLKQVAAAAFRSATAAADEAQAQVNPRRNALRSDVAEQPDVARGSIMDRAATALSRPNARAAIVRNPLGAAYHASLATGLAAGMPRDVALLFAGASQSGVDLGSPSSGDAPKSTVVRRTVRKRFGGDGGGEANRTGCKDPRPAWQYGRCHRIHPSVSSDSISHERACIAPERPIFTFRVCRLSLVL